MGNKNESRERAAKVTRIDAWRGRMPEYDQTQEVPLRSPNQRIHYGGRTIVGGRPMMIVAKGSKRDSMTPEELLEDLYGKPIESIDIKFRDEPARKTS